MSGDMSRRRLRRTLSGYAAEFAIVVVGVFIALWADSHAEDRKQSAARTELLASLESEIRANMTALDTAAKYDGLTVEAMRRLIAIHDATDPVPSPDSLETLLGWANSFRRAAQHGLSFGAYDAMIATGTSHLLPSREIGERLARHRFALASGQGDESLAERALEHLQAVMRVHGGMLAFSPEEHFERRGIAYRQRDRELSDLLRDPAFADALYVRTIYESNIVSFYRRQREELAQTLLLVREDPPRRGEL